MNAPSGPAIPLDVYFEIIDHVASECARSNSRTSLTDCALTCSAWLGRARFRLYNYVFLMSEEGKLNERVYAFSRTISESPKLGALVTSLEILLADHSLYQAQDKCEDDWQGPFNTQAMANLCNLRCLTLSDSCIDFPDKEFVSLLTRRISMAPSVEVFKLQDVTLDSIRETVSILERLPRLSVLELVRLEWYIDIVPPADEICASFCSKLTRVVISEPCLYYPFLQILPPTTKVVELGPFWENSPRLEVPTELPADYFKDISRFTGLETLKIFVRIEYDEEMDWIRDLLAHARNLSFRELFLRYQCGKPFSKLVGITRWSEVDNILANGPFSSLQRVVMEMVCYEPAVQASPAERRALDQHIQATFRGCARRGIVVVHDVAQYAW